MQQKTKIITRLIGFSVLVLILHACGTKKTPSGVKVNFLKKGSGIEVKGGTYLLMNILFKDQKDSVWTDTKKTGMPIIIQMMDSVAKGDMTMEVFRMLKKGDSVTFKVPAKNLFEKTFHSPLPHGADSTTQFTFNIGLLDVMTMGQVQKYQMKQDSIRRIQFEKDKVAQLAKDIAIIDSFLKEKNITAQKTKSGLRYVITKPGKGENAKSGQSVKVNYVGRLLNGKFFDTSIESVAKANKANTGGRKYEPFSLVLGNRQVIPGWEEGLMLMNRGSKMTLYIPSGLAYGPQQRSEVILPNSILVFDMELLGISKPK